MECLILIRSQEQYSIWKTHSNKRKFSVPGPQLVKEYFDKGYKVKILFVDNEDGPLEMAKITNVRKRNESDTDYPESCEDGKYETFMEFVNIPFFAREQFILFKIIQEASMGNKFQALVSDTYDYYYRSKSPVYEDESLTSAFSNVKMWTSDFLI